MVWHLRHPTNDPPENDMRMMMDAVKEKVSHELDTLELRYWCSDKTILRYCRARKWHLDKAIKMLIETIHWRKIHRPEDITFEQVESESKWGKLYILVDPYGKPVFDKSGRPIVVIRTRHEHNISTKEEAVRHFAYVMDICSALADKYSPDLKLSWLVDYEQFSYSKNSLPMGTVRELVRILQNHYPERLGQVVCFKPPKIFSLFWTAVSPFLDEVTAKKVAFLTEAKLGEMNERFNVQQLEPAFGGTGCHEWCLETWKGWVKNFETEHRRTIREATLPVVNMAASAPYTVMG